MEDYLATVNEDFVEYYNYTALVNGDLEDGDVQDESTAYIKNKTNVIKSFYGKEYEDEVNTGWCDYKWLYSLLVYGIVGIMATILALKGIHTAFIWPTLSTLCSFNVLLHSCNYVKRYATCIVGGMAWEGFMFYESDRTRIEQDYIFAHALTWRNYQKKVDKD